MTTDGGSAKAHRVCPWWLGYLLASPIRKIWQDPAKILAPYVREGQRVLEPGPGMGFFTLELARLVGPQGRVYAVDLQAKMIDTLKRRAARAGLGDRIEARVASADSLAITDLQGTIDFVLAFAMVHEMPDGGKFFREAASATKPGGRLLLAEPEGHVKDAMFEGEVKLAVSAGFELTDRPRIGHSLAALLTLLKPSSS